MCPHLILLAIVICLNLLAEQFCLANLLEAGPCSNTVDPIDCKLNQIVIGPFDFPCFSKPESENVVLCIGNFKCNQIDLAAFPSSYIPPRVLDLSILGLHVNCTGELSITKNKPRNQTTITRTFGVVLNEASLNLNTTFGIETDGILISSVNLQDCNITAVNFTLYPVESEEVTIELEAIFKSFLDTLICSNFSDFLATNVTNAIVEELDPKLVSIIYSPGTDSIHNPNFKLPKAKVVRNAHFNLKTLFSASPIPVIQECVDWNTSIIASVHKSINHLTADGLKFSNGFQFAALKYLSLVPRIKGKIRQQNSNSVSKLN